MSSKYSRGQERLWEGHKGYNVDGRLLFLKRYTQWVQNEMQVLENSIQGTLYRVRTKLSVSG